MDYFLRLNLDHVEQLALRYVAENVDQAVEDSIERVIAPKTKQQGFFDRDDFLQVCRWKTPRSQHLCLRNDEAFVREVTRIALATENERLRIETLNLLDGVDWPTASVLLHFAHTERYPILDVRALESLSITPPDQYTFKFWYEYVMICRYLADEAKVSMRTLDRALWQHSAINQ